MRIFLLLFAFYMFVSAENEFSYSDASEVSQKVLYSSYKSVPESVIKGQIFPIVIKTLSTEIYFKEIRYRFTNAYGVRLLNEEPITRQENYYYYHTFYFVATHNYLRMPKITISLVHDNHVKDDLAFLKPKMIKVVTLNPPKDFANIIANDLQVTQYKTNHYNDIENIAVFSMEALYAIGSDFSIPGEYKQGFESNVSTIEQSNLTYYIIIPKSFEQLEFSYFNLKSQKFEKIIIPIIVDDDMVSTQSNLAPKDHRHTQIKLYIAIAMAAVSLLLFIVRKRYFYLLVFLTVSIYAIFIAVPIQNTCVKQGSAIYLLPMNNGTIFETTQTEKIFEIEGSIDGYIKVKLQNNKIGWIRNEALCSP
ncbi:MAG: hypothetical protein U9R50_12510 [Campylobacterota bacterium]|nr:hypothetical protein [Campylobacterota bacterium]